MSDVRLGASDGAARPGLTGRLLLGAIALYRSVSAGRAPRCRFIPSCSEYAVEAVSGLGPTRALPLIARRLSRCRPGGGFGYDPVPGRCDSAPAAEGGSRS